MGLSIYNIKKWAKMLTGTSILHVNQGVGKIYSKKNIKGYYNDLTEKVLKCKEFNEKGLPVIKSESGQSLTYPVTIFQFGLGAYDLYLISGEKKYLDLFYRAVNWAILHQDKNGAWNANALEDKKSKALYSGMLQGEAISLLCRAYEVRKKNEYLEAIQRAIKILIKPVEQGGTARYIKDEIYFLEYTNQPVILNGWIFAVFGIFDYLLLESDHEIEEIWKKTIVTLKRHLKDFDNGFWSMYNIETYICSPFYHKLHIALLHVLYNITDEKIFLYYSKKWNRYNSFTKNKTKAFLIKSYQKIVEK